MVNSRTPTPCKPPPRDIIVPASKEILEIHFTSLNLAAPERARFQYRPDDHESKWIETRGMREARFTKLPHGRYRFQVRACNEDGIWSPAPAVLGIIVEPPFWKTRWFQTLAAAGLLGVISGTVYFISTQNCNASSPCCASTRRWKRTRPDRAGFA